MKWRPGEASETRKLTIFYTFFLSKERKRRKMQKRKRKDSGIMKERWKGGEEYRHETVELFGLDHFAEPENLFVDDTFAGLAGRTSRLGVLRLPCLLRVRHCSPICNRSEWVSECVCQSLCLYTWVFGREEKRGKKYLMDGDDGISLARFWGFTLLHFTNPFFFYLLKKIILFILIMNF